MAKVIALIIALTLCLNASAQTQQDTCCACCNKIAPVDSVKELREKGFILISLGILSHAASLFGIKEDNKGMIIVFNTQGIALDVAGISMLIEARRMKKKKKKAESER